MNWRSNPIVIRLRRIGRELGVNQKLARILSGCSYEERFKTVMLRAVRRGDVVWDVGANIGVYTREFARSVGPTGRVFAFEPSPQNAAKLRANLGDVETVVVVDKGLGDRAGTVKLLQGEDALGATSRLVMEEGDPSTAAMVIVARGDELTASGDVTPPNVVKIDTEGFEYEVLLGLGDLLHRSELHTICIEVHFHLLGLRGLDWVPRAVEEKLRAAGFNVQWTDASHIVGTR